MLLSKIKNYIMTEILNIRLKPQTLQMPITGKCNSRCNTCNIWKQEKRNDVDITDLDSIINDPYFTKVKNVGINGGEPFLHKNILGVIEKISQLPSLERVYLISNGLMTDKILYSLEAIHKLLVKRNITLNLTISLDGVDDVYTDVRGIPNGYQKVMNTISMISKNKDIYCDSLTIGTTISIKNIDYVKEVSYVAEILEVPINYHIAVPNRRIFTNDDFERYSVLYDETARLRAVEFFYGLFKHSSSIKDKLLYFQNYYYLKSGGKERPSGCNYKNQDLTIDENLNLYYCAKESKTIGNLKKANAVEILKKNESRDEEKRIQKYCNGCGHYITIPSIKGVLLMIKEILTPGIWIVYKYLSFRKISGGKMQ